MDDLLITGINEAEIKEVKLKLMHEFEMSDLGSLSYFLRVKFKDAREGVFLHQTKYARDILRRFKISNYNTPITPLENGAKLKKETNDEFVSVRLYKQIIGSLRYLYNTRHDICQSVRLLCRIMEKPQKCYLITIKRAVRYIKGTIDHGVLMPRQKNTNTNAEVYGYTDSNFSGDQDEKKIIVGYIFIIEDTSIS